MTGHKLARRARINLQSSLPNVVSRGQFSCVQRLPSEYVRTQYLVDLIGSVGKHMQVL